MNYCKIFHFYLRVLNTILFDYFNQSIRQIFLAKEDSSDEEIVAADGTVAEFEENPEDEMSVVFPVEDSFEVSFILRNSLFCR
mgnify:CR=1 FL=1